METQNTPTRPRPVVLTILDGWGVGPASSANAITTGETPHFDAFTQKYFTTALHAAGEAVGLKWGEIGNSEVGHLNIGAGRIIYQPQPRIDHAIIDGSFFTNKALVGACDVVKQSGGTLHIMGLISDTGVHATIEHSFALLELAQQYGVTNVLFHAILDGRDAPYNSAPKYIERLEDRMKQIGIGRVASVSGRYYTMDRDNHWDRIEKGYRAIVEGVAPAAFPSAAAAVSASYKENIFDEHVIPVVIVPDGGAPHTISDADAVIFFNFRADRARQITRAITADEFDGFIRNEVRHTHFVAFTEYDERLAVTVAFPSPNVEYSLARVVSDAGLSQLHVAESEKYAHVTYFVNGGREAPFPGEERILIPSPPVTSYEQKPEMSAPEIREKVLMALEKNQFDVIIINFANADMVGHTGNMDATLQAVHVLDRCLGDIAEKVISLGGVMCITADHGNAEKMLVQTTGEINKEHSSSPVPFIVIGESFGRAPELESPPDLSKVTPGGLLSDIAPTILKILNLPIPDEMDGRSLV